MDFSKVKSLIIPEGKVKQIVCNGITLWKASFKNWVRFSTESDKVTIYNGGLGYKNLYRIRSGGGEKEESQASCTGYIPVKGLSVVRVAGTKSVFKNNHVSQAINAYDASLNCLGQLCGNANYDIFNNAYKAYGADSVVEKGSYYEWIVPPTASKVAYIRVTGNNTDGSELIVTVDEEIV